MCPWVIPQPSTRIDLTAGSAEQAQQYAEEAARLGSFARLLDLHWDAAAQQFRDWGNHTQDVALQWQVNRLPNGRIVSRELVRVVQGEPPEPQFVPHFGCAPLSGMATAGAGSVIETLLAGAHQPTPTEVCLQSLVSVALQCAQVYKALQAVAALQPVVCWCCLGMPALQ